MNDPVFPLTELAKEINIKHAQVVGAVCEGVESALACGRLLIQAKDCLPRRRWLAWLAQHCPGLTESRAELLMSVACDDVDSAQQTRRA